MAMEPRKRKLRDVVTLVVVGIFLEKVFILVPSKELKV